jgi:hypothetical protein
VVLCFIGMALATMLAAGAFVYFVRLGAAP